MTITLSEQQLKTLLLAAEEAQVAREHELAKMRENPDYERHEIMHFTSKMRRTDDAILEAEKNLSFLLKLLPSLAQPLTVFDLMGFSFGLYLLYAPTRKCKTGGLG